MCSYTQHVKYRKKLCCSNEKLCNLKIYCATTQTCKRVNNNNVNKSCDLKLLKLREIFELRPLTFVFHSVKKTSPSCFHVFFLLSSSVHHYSTRHASQGTLCLLLKNSLRYGLKSTRYLGAKLWNILPIEVRNAPSKSSFKTKLKSYILNKVDR